MPQDSQGRYSAPDESNSTFDVASAARTATGNSSTFDTTGVDNINGAVVVSAASGTTPTLDLSLQTSADGTNFYNVGSFTQKTTTTAAEAKIFGPLGASSRWRWVIAGTTPSFTFAVTTTVDRDN